MSAGSNEDFTASAIMADARRLQSRHGAKMIAAVMRRLRLAAAPSAHPDRIARAAALRVH